MTERDEALEPFFAAGRSDGGLPDDFLARLEADAAAALPAPVVVPFRARVMPQLWTGGGLLAAGVAGVAIGFFAPETLNGLVEGGEVYDLAEFLPGANPAAVFGELE